MKNKRIKLIVCVCFAICLMAFAASGQHSTSTAVILKASTQTAVVTLKSSIPNPSGEFNITIAVNTQVNTYGITGKIAYDNTRVDYIPKEDKGGLASNIYDNGTSAVIVDFVDIAASFSQKEFILATLSFKVKNDAPGGDAVFSYTSLDYFDTIVRAVAVEPVNVTVTIDGTDIPHTPEIQVEMDGIDLQRNGEVWIGSVSSQVDQIDTNNIRIYGVPNDARVEFSPSGTIELGEGEEKSIVVTITKDTGEEVYMVKIIRKSAVQPGDDGANENAAQTWIILSIVITLFLLSALIFYFTRRGKRNSPHAL